MPVDYKQIYRDLHDFVVLATALPDESVRPAFEREGSINLPRERGAIVTIAPINQIELGIDSRRYENQELPDTDVVESVIGDRNLTASINVYADDGADNSQLAQSTIELIRLFLRSSKGAEYLNTHGLGYLRSGSTINLSSLQNGSWENRRQVDVEFHIITSIENEVNAINSAEIGFAFYGSDTITGTIEVTP